MTSVSASANIKDFYETVRNDIVIGGTPTCRRNLLQKQYQ